MDLMRAVLVTRFGGTEVLCPAEVERPSPISTEGLVRVVAAGVNPVDCKTRRGEGVARGAHVISTTDRDDRDALQSRDADVALHLVGGRDTSALIATVRQGGLLLAVPDGADDGVKAEAASRGVRVEEPLVEPDGHALDEIAKLVSSGEGDGA